MFSGCISPCIRADLNINMSSVPMCWIDKTVNVPACVSEHISCVYDVFKSPFSALRPHVCVFLSPLSLFVKSLTKRTGNCRVFRFLCYEMCSLNWIKPVLCLVCGCEFECVFFGRLFVRFSGCWRVSVSRRSVGGFGSSQELLFAAFCQ